MFTPYLFDINKLYTALCSLKNKSLDRELFIETNNISEEEFNFINVKFPLVSSCESDVTLTNHGAMSLLGNQEQFVQFLQQAYLLRQQENKVLKSLKSDLQEIQNRINRIK